MLTNDFDKKIVLAFLKIIYKKKKKIAIKKILLILNICSFQKKMLSNLTYLLIYSLTKCIFEDGFKDSCVLKIL